MEYINNEIVSLEILNITNDPVETVNDPVETVNDPVETVNDPTETVNDPVETVNDPTETDTMTCNTPCIGITKIVIKYDNEQTEELIVCNELYSNIKNKWLVDQPPFISDRFKNIMNNIILACIHKNERCINELNAYFAVGNEENVKLFFNYMRKRDLTEEKKKWKIIS
jgi:hypothetical protein